MWTHFTRGLLAILINVIALTVGLTAQAEWHYIETPGCEFVECVIIADGEALCQSDSCGIFRVLFKDSIAFPLQIGSDTLKFVPRSIAISKTGVVHVVGHQIDYSVDHNRATIPKHYYSTNQGITWIETKHEIGIYGKYQSVRVLDDESLLIAYEQSTPYRGNDFEFDTFQVVIIKLRDQQIVNTAVLSSTSSTNGFSCFGYYLDYYTVWLTTDGFKRVAAVDVSPCYRGPDPGIFAPYGYNRFYSYDGGRDFPDHLGPRGEWDMSQSRPDRIFDPLYLTRDFWIDDYRFNEGISRDQGNTWKDERIPISDRADSVSISKVWPAIIRDRIAAGTFVQETIGDTLFVVVFGTFNLDDGVFNVEHRDTLRHGAYMVSASQSGYAVAPGGYGVFVREPSGISSVDEESRGILRVYPNPANNEITIAGTNEADQVRIESIQGIRVTEFHAGGFSTTINISSLPSGPYVLRNGSTSQALLFHVLR